MVAVNSSERTTNSRSIITIVVSVERTHLKYLEIIHQTDT